MKTRQGSVVTGDWWLVAGGERRAATDFGFSFEIQSQQTEAAARNYFIDSDARNTSAAGLGFLGNLLQHFKCNLDEVRSSGGHFRTLSIFSQVGEKFKTVELMRDRK